MILPLDSDVTLDEGGGKGANLARLVRAGFLVPPGFIVTTRAYRDFVSVNDLQAWILETARAARPDDPTSLEAASTAIRARFDAASIATELAEVVRAAYAALDRPPVAVRSSATTEDLPELSFAGQQDTILNVVADDPLLRAIVQCWSSLWTARAIGYRARNGIPHESAALAVVVQRMIASEVSGVLFTANPLTGKRTEVVIDATFGLGEALVSGRVEPDQYVVDDAAGRVLNRRIGAKALVIRPRAGGGTAEAQETAAGRVALDDAAIITLARLGRRVAALFGAPQDVEWARADGKFHLLQARPITSLYPLPEGLPLDGRRVLISFGAIQGMLDPMTPLGQDVFRVALPRGLASFGVLTPTASPAVVAGERLFVDITPAARRTVRNALRAVEPSTGVVLDELFAESSRPPAEGAPPRDERRWRFHVPTISPRLLNLTIRLLGNLIYNLTRPDHGRARIQRRLRSVVERFEQRCASATTLSEQVSLLEETFEWALLAVLPLLVPALGVGVGGLQLVRELAALLPDGERRALELTRGLPHNVTTEMDLALWEVARSIQADPAAAKLFRSADPRALAREVLAGRLPPPAQGAIDSFLDRYGMRGVAEIDIGRPRWRDDPTPLMDVLQSYLRIEDPEQAPDATFRRGADATRHALASLVADVRRTRSGRLKAVVLTWAARRMRALAGLRESPKFTVIQLLGAVRAGLQRSGRELAASGVLAAPDDIFFLHVGELRSLAAGEGRDWRSVIGDRRDAYAREQRRRRVPRVLLSDGRAFYGGVTDSSTSGSVLTGTPVSPGVVDGPAHVVLDPHGAQLTPGDILVCRGTDPAWTPLFLAAGGLVTEVGGLMTHGSVVAREYGIPAVVGVHDATTRLQTGERVRVDGTKGQVTILDGSTQP